MSEGGDWKSTSRKSSDCRVWKSSALGVVPGDSTEVWGEIHINRGRVGEERGGKEIDGCPLTLVFRLSMSISISRSKLKLVF
jgi:hypothetical protein